MSIQYKRGNQIQEVLKFNFLFQYFFARIIKMISALIN